MPIEPRALLLGSALLALAPSAHAALDLRPFANATYEHDDNVLRFADAEEAQAQRGSPQLGDTVRRAAVGSWAQLGYGRQALRGFAEVRRIDHAEFGELDRTEGELEGRLDWSIGIPWSGHLLYDHVRKLEPVTSSESGDLGMQTLQESELFAGYEVVPGWRAEGGTGLRRKRHTRDEAENSDLDERRFRLGFSWASALATAGAGVESTRGHFPNRIASPETGVVDRYWQTDYHLRASREITGLSTFESELGYTRRNGPEAAGGGFSGVTGKLRYLWRLTRQTTADTQAFRRLRDIEERDTNYVDELGMSTSLQFALTRTLGISGKAYLAEQDYVGAIGEEGVVRNDSVRRYEAGLSWTPRRSIALKPSAGREYRTSTREDRSFDATFVGVTLEVRTD
jgi:hypothetical protein